MLTYFHRCLFALALFALALVTQGVTGRPLPILEETGVDSTPASPSSQSTAPPLVLSPKSANVPATEALVSPELANVPAKEALVPPPSPRVEDTTTTAAENVQEAPKAIGSAVVTQANIPTRPVVETIATPAMTDEDQPKTTDNSPPQDGAGGAVVEEGKTSTMTPSVEFKSLATESSTTIHTKSPPFTETFSAVPVEEAKEPESPVPESKGDALVATPTPNAEKSESPVPESPVIDALPDSRPDVAADSPHIEEATPHNDHLLESTSTPVVENGVPALPNTGAATTKEIPKKDVVPETKQETTVDPDVSTPAIESAPARTEGEPAVLSAATTDEKTPQTPPPTTKEPTDHKVGQMVDMFNAEKETKPAPAIVDNGHTDPLQNKILPLINKKRARHDSKPLAWNATLAHMASLRLADQCVMPYGQERDRRGVTYALIKNVDKATGPDLSQAVGDWYDEGSFFNYNNPARNNMWRATTQAGCATKACGDKDNSVGLFCIWNPAGNAVIENIPLKPDGTPQNVDINKKIRQNVRPAVPPRPSD